MRLLVGRSTIIDVGSAIARVSLTSADIADAVVTSANQLLVNGKMPGTISMFVWDRAGAIRRYELVVARDLSRLNEQLHQLFPGEAVAAQSNGKDVVLSGLVTNKDVAEKAVNLAAGYVDKKEEVVSLVQVRDGRRQQPGDAARPLRRGQPQRVDGARCVVFHRSERLQERSRPHHHRAVPGADLRQLRSDGVRASWCSAIS